MLVDNEYGNSPIHQSEIKGQFRSLQVPIELSNIDDNLTPQLYKCNVSLFFCSCIIYLLFPCSRWKWNGYNFIVGDGKMNDWTWYFQTGGLNRTKFGQNDLK